MHLFVTGLLSSGVFLSFLCCFILFFKNRETRKSNIFLVLVFLFVGCFLLRHLLIFSHEILSVPLYYQLLSPFYYLVPPCIYLYIVMILNKTEERPRFYLLHFLPVLLMIVDILPWCNMLPCERYLIVTNVVKHPGVFFKVSGGLFPNWFHQILRFSQGLVYILFQVKLIRSLKASSDSAPVSLRYLKIYKWSVLLTTVMAVMYIILIVYLMFRVLNGFDRPSVYQAMYLPVCFIAASFLMVALYLYFNPDLLYNRVGEADEVLVPEGEIVQGLSASASVAVKGSYSRELLGMYQDCLAYELEENKIFTIKGLTVTQLAAICDIPSRALAYLFINVYEKQFNDFINEYRLQYVVARMGSSNWKLLTIEGLAMEAGFSSRTTFFRAFKNKYGMSPTTYLNTIIR